MPYSSLLCSSNDIYFVNYSLRETSKLNILFPLTISVYSVLLVLALYNSFFKIISLASEILCVFQTLLFNPPPNSKPFSKGQGVVGQDLDLYVDCFVSCFRITPHNNDVLKVCLNSHSPPMYHLVLVTALHKIITQVGILNCRVASLSPLMYLSPGFGDRSAQNYHIAKYFDLQNG